MLTFLSIKEIMDKNLRDDSLSDFRHGKKHLPQQMPFDFNRISPVHYYRRADRNIIKNKLCSIDRHIYATVGAICLVYRSAEVTAAPGGIMQADAEGGDIIPICGRR